MTSYIINIILCPAIFILTYKLLLEKESMHLFNRFYLLFSLALSFVIPAITFKVTSSILPISKSAVFKTQILQNDLVTQTLSPGQHTNYFYIILLTIYVTITTLLLFRFFYNLNKIFSRAWANPTIPYKKARIVFISENVAPHSFLNYLFISEADYKNGHIEQEILIHEYAHFLQKHSYDLLFVEILQAVFWFNPFVFLYRKAIQLNHEFLADEAVIHTSKNIRAYQHLLIENAGKNKTYNLTSRFNYLITKKRILMMTKTKSFRNALCRQIAIIPVFAITLFVFSKKSFAQDSTTNENTKQTVSPSMKEGVNQDLLNEYNQIVNGHKKNKQDQGYQNLSKFSDAEKNRLETIYLAMSKDQQANQIVVFLPVPPLLTKEVPTQAEIESWKDPKIYGVWIDGKRVSNVDLSNYTNTDFSHAFVSKLSKNALNYGKHYYQVDLMTNAYYVAYNKARIESNEKYYMGFRMRSK